MIESLTRCSAWQRRGVAWNLPAPGGRRGLGLLACRLVLGCNAREFANVSRIFISHSSLNNAEAVALYAWLEREGWKDEIFLDLDPERGIAAGERWERRLHEAANRCEAVLFLVSRAWLASKWCVRELNLA